MFWPFNISAKRREREAQQRREEAARLQRIKDSIETENRRQLQRSATITGASGYRAPAAPQQGASVASAQRSAASSTYDDPLSPANPLSSLSPINQAASWSAPAEEPRHAAPSHCGSSSSSHSSHSSSDYGSSSHSHSSHDHSCSSSSSDSGSSSSYDSGSSSSSSDW